MPEVVVAGAGLAGLACALHLTGAGVDVAVPGRAGGRGPDADRRPSTGCCPTGGSMRTTPATAELLPGPHVPGPVANNVVLSNGAPSYAPGRTLLSCTATPTRAAVRRHVTRLYGVDTARWQQGVPDHRPPMGRFGRAVKLEDGLYVCGAHRDSGSVQGAVVSGRRAVTAVLSDLRDRP